MYHRTESPRVARRQAEPLPGHDPEAAARRAVERVRKVLTAYRSGMPFDPAALRAALADEVPQLEAERLFALGWLHWLDGAYAEAEPLLAKAVDLSRSANVLEQLAESAYWLARVRIRLDRLNTISDYETELRRLGGSPQATAWFVDLLWRVGWVGRAEQVWKSVRGNKRVVGCPEAPLLEARSLLQRGAIGDAVKALVEARPTNAVLWVERLLLLAWAEVAQGRRDKALEFFRRIEELPYPRAVLAMWKSAVEGPVTLAERDFIPLVLRDLARGYLTLLEGRVADSVEAFRVAQSHPAAQMFARYALARLGHDSIAEILTSHPGLFLAVRCRVWLALERFRQRQGTTAEWLETLRRQGRLSFVPGRDVDHFRRLAQILSQSPDVEALRVLVSEHEQAEPAVRRNIVRAALEVARDLPGEEAKILLSAWAKSEWLAADEELRQIIGRLLLRLHLQEANAAEVLTGDPLLQPASVLWEAAGTIAADDSWRERVRGLRSSPRWRSLAQALLLQEAARRGDASAVVALLEEVDAWRGFRPAPPAFVLRAVESVAAAQPAHVGLRRALARWLQNWDLPALGLLGANLATHAGISTIPASRAEAPTGVIVAAWLLHQAARAIGREDAVEALACVRRAQQIDPEWTTVPNAAAVRDALPELERLALAQSFAVALRPEETPAVVPSHLLADLVDLLRQQPDGEAILAAASNGDSTGVCDGLAALVARSDLPPRLAHHLALVELRSAQDLEEADATAAAEPHWRRAWTAWLRFLAAPPEIEGSAAPGSAQLLFDALLAAHRRRISDLLARNAVDAARRHWVLVQELPTMAIRHSETLGRDLTARVERFRDELASAYLVTTRESMRYGDIPEGWHADYEKGLTHLRRLLSLDHDNVRLLTALVEVCGDWFLDLYNTEDRDQLMEQVARFSPFAQQLVRLTETRSGELAARAALSEYFKFRGFVALDRAEKVSMYREALRCNPANENVRELLRGLDEDE